MNKSSGTNSSPGPMGEKRASAGPKGKLLSALKDEVLGTNRDLNAIIDQLVVIKLFESIVG